jgi:hypothetical protein
MLDIAYQSLTQDGDDAYAIGAVSHRPADGYVWHYWIPSQALLNRRHLRLRRLDQVLVEGGPFVFPLELRWEFLEWFARGAANDFLTPHVPPAVLSAVRAERAVILLFFGHEGRPLSFTHTPTGEEQSAYDLIFGFISRYDLPPGAVWFISGNLSGRPEYESWKHRRLGDKKLPNPFETRFAEPYSYLVQAIQRAHEQGFDLTVRLHAAETAHHDCLHRATHLTVNPIPQNAIRAHAHLDTPRTAPPPKLFLCMNRATRPHRRAVVCHLLRRGFLDRSVVSFRDDQPHQTRFDDWEMEEAWQELQKRQPLIIDRDLPLDFDRYMQDNFAAVTIGEVWPYRDTFFSIVTETHFSNNVLFVSEKAWKPLVNEHPFVIVGTPGTLAYLRSLGFQTFTPIIDEHYDSLVDNNQRLQALFAVIDSLGALNDNRRAAMLNEMQSILAHNVDHLRQLKSPMSRIWSEIDAKLGGSA